MLGRVWIADRGMASRENLAWLRESGRRYIIGAPKSELKKFAGALAATTGWREVREGVEVKLARCPDTGETVILCRSADRRSKEQAMHDKFSRRIEAGLERLAARIARSKKRIDREQVNRQIGRLLQQVWHQRADRVEAHILVCFLAFVLWKTLEMWQSRAGLGNSPRTCSKSSRASNRTTLCCRPPPTARSRCAASPSPTPPRPPFSTVLPKRMRLAEPELPALAASA
jgi:transposase